MPETTARPTLEMAALNVDIEAGLLTKNEFYRRLDDVILDLRTPDMQQIGLAIGLLDVRALKEMNDVYAPELGDMTLFAANIALRQTASFPTRFYGDDFGGLYEINPRRLPIKTQAAIRERQLELQNDISAAFLASFLALGQSDAFSWVLNHLGTTAEEIVRDVPSLGIHVSLTHINPDKTCQENMYEARQALKNAKSASRAEILNKLSPEDQLRVADLLRQLRVLTGLNPRRNLGIRI